MAESLLFRKGSLANLNNADLVAGAVSFTTDEPAIYLDVQQGNEIVRKRVGDLIVYNTRAELIADGNKAVDGTIGNWSTSALYYVIEGNALLKWNGSSWTQINSISDVEASFADLDKVINGDPVDPGDSGLVGKVSSLENRMDQAEDDIGALQDKVGAVPADQNLYALISGEIARSTDKDDEHDEALETLDGRVDTLEGYVGTPKNGNIVATGLHLAVDNNTAAISTLSNNFTEYKEDVSDAIAQAIANETSRADTEEKRLAGLISNLDTAYKAADSGLDEKITALSNKLDGYKANWEAEDAKIRGEFAAADITLKTELKGYIDTNMAAADAMRYMGVVNSASDLPTTTEAIEAGWTYKVGKEFTANDKIDTDEGVILKGDLLIASVDLVEGATIPNNFWHHISSGYEDDKDPILTAITTHDAEGKETGFETEIIMKSHIPAGSTEGDDRGSVKFVGATGQNVVISSVASIDDEQTGDMSTTVTVGLNWVEF